MVHTYKVTVDTISSNDFKGHVVNFNPLGIAANDANISISTPATILPNQDFGYMSSGILSSIRVKATQGSLVRYSNVTATDGMYKIDNLPVGYWNVELDTATLPANISYSMSQI